jgi:hypothetical protein
VKAVFALLAAALATGEVRTLSPGPFEASGAAAVAGTQGILFVDDGRPGEVLWLELTAAGQQQGAVAAVPLGVEVDDPEGITTDGTHFYVVGSQSRGKGGGGIGLVRFRFDAARRSVSDVQSLSGLKALLAERVPELRGYGRKGGERGINIEGLAWDPAGSRLLLGLRSPLVDGMALVVPLKLGGDRPLSADGLRVDGPALKVALGSDDGIRGMEHDAAARAFRIIVGASKGGGEARLVEWNGQGTATREIRRFAGALKPEGVAATKLAGRDITVVLCDSSRFLLLD